MRYKPTNIQKARRIVIRKIYKAAKHALDKANSRYSFAEVALWPKLEEEAKHYKDTGEVLAYLDAETSDANVAARADKIIAKAAKFRKLRGSVVKERKKHVHAVRQLETVDEVLAYDFSSLKELR